MTDDRFATTEGSGVQELDGTIADFYFQDGEYGCSICIKIQFDDPVNFPQFPDGMYTQWYPLGSDYGAVAGGESVTGPNKWSRNNDAGRLLHALGQVPGVAEALPADWAKEQAASWKGLHLHWERESYPIKRYKKDENKKRIIDPTTGKGILEDATASVLLPKALLDTQLTISSNGAGVSIDSLGLSSEQVNALALVAQTAANGAKFIEGVVGYDASLMAGGEFAAALSKDAEGVRKALAEAIF